jgi:anti-sigma regulatory factor (Ser/Thr protein kinase)
VTGFARWAAPDGNGGDLPPRHTQQGLRHDAYFYADGDCYLADLLRFVRGGLARDEPVLIAVPRSSLERLRADLSADEASRVCLSDIAVAGRNPGRVLGLLLTPFVRHHADRPVRIVSEATWPGRTDHEYPACAEHEALVNLALADTLAHILCPFDLAGLPPPVLADAERTHPTVIWRDQRRASPSYADPHAGARLFDRPLSPAPEDAEILVVNTITGPRTARRFAYEFGERTGLPPPRLADLTLAVHELAVNSIVHAGGAGLLMIWTGDGHVVVQVDDAGEITDPLVGRRPPAPSEIGHGLYIVHQVADLVRVHRSGEGTSVRAYFRLP